MGDHGVSTEMVVFDAERDRILDAELAPAAAGAASGPALLQSRGAGG